MTISSKDHRVLQQECVGQVKHESSGTRGGGMSIDVSNDINDIYYSMINYLK